MQLNEIYLALSSPVWKLTLSAGLVPFRFSALSVLCAIIFFAADVTAELAEKDSEHSQQNVGGS
jgi:hypothetical protein